MTTMLACRRKLGTIFELVQRLSSPEAEVAPPVGEADILESARNLIRQGGEATPPRQRALVDNCLRQARAGASSRDRVEAAAALLALAHYVGKGELSLELRSAKLVFKTYRALTELPTSLIDDRVRETFDLTDREVAAATEGEPREQLALAVALGLWRLSDVRLSAGELLAEARSNLGNIWRKLTC